MTLQCRFGLKSLIQAGISGLSAVVNLWQNRTPFIIQKAVSEQWIYLGKAESGNIHLFRLFFLNFR